MRARNLLAALALLASVPAHAGSAIWPTTVCASPANWNQSSQRWPAPACSGTSGAVDATLQWLVSTGYYAPSDSYDAAAGYAVALATGTGLPVAGGSRAILPFTLAGGAPTLGQTVWLASAQDDNYYSATANGAATATLPVRSVDHNVGAKNIVPVGTVASAVNLGTGGAPKYAVTMASSIAPSRPAPPSNTTFTVNRVKFDASGANYWSALVSTTTQVEVLNNESICVKFQVDEVGGTSANLAMVVRNYPPGAATGWQAYEAGAGGGVTYDPRGGGGDISQIGVAGLNVECWTRYGGLIHFAMDGYAVQTTADTGTTAGGSGEFRIAGVDGTSSLFGITKLSRTMNDAELVAVTGATYQAFLSANANIYTPVLTGDASCQWKFDATTYVSGTPHALNCGTGSNFDFTVVGTPTVLTKTITHYNQPASLVMTGPTGAYDSDGYLSTRAFNYVGFTVSTQAEWADVIVGMSNTDFDDADEESSSLTVNGIPLIVTQANTALSTPYIQRVIKGAGAEVDPVGLYGQVSPPYHVRYDIGEKMARWGSFTSGPRLLSIALPSTATMDSPTASKAMAFIDGSATTSGHGGNLLTASAVSGAVISRIRNDYPGIVIAPNVMTKTTAGAGLKYMGNFASSASVLPFVRLIYDSLQTVAAGGAVKSYVFFEGEGDWDASTPLATFTTNYALALDTIHTLDPTAIVIMLLTAQSNLYATSNGTNTLQQFVDAENTIAGTRGWITKLDVTGPTAITWTSSGSAIGRAPVQPAGAAALKGNIKTRIHAAQPTVY